MSPDRRQDGPNGVEPVGDELKPGTALLQGQYRIERYLSSGGFGVTYLARDSLDRLVVIKECFPSAMCCRTQNTVRVRSRTHQNDFEKIVQLFGKEARALAKLAHPHIVGVHQVFEDNHTAYMALDYVEGRELLEVIDSGSAALGPPEIKSMLLKLLSAVSYIHDRGILHRDISPDNILLDERLDPVLIDFGAAREQAQRATRALSALHTVKDGYSPQEFYLAGGKQTPASDLYALAATFYHVLTGEAPPNSQLRLAAIAERKPDPYVPVQSRVKTGYDNFFLEGIDTAMALFPRDRLQTAHDWIELIDTEKRRKAALERAKKDKLLEMAINQLVSDTGSPEPVAPAAKAPAAVAAPADPPRAAAPRPQTVEASASQSPARRPRTGVFDEIDVIIPKAQSSVSYRRPGLLSRVFSAPLFRFSAMPWTRGSTENEADR